MPASPSPQPPAAPHILHREQWVASPLEEVFQFFSEAQNLEALTPSWLRFEIITPLPIAMSPGTLIDYKLHWHGIPMRWRTEITRWDPPHLFQDVQLLGPYGLWHHTHEFRAVDGGTQIKDVVRYALPFGPLGKLVHALTVRDNVEQIFNYRYDRIQERFGGPSRV